MRVTSKMLADNALLNLQAILRRLEKTSERLTTGRNVRVPSDDPAATEAAIRLRTALTETEQYIRNADGGLSWLESVDAALNQATQILQRARELTVYGATDTLGQSEREAIAAEVEQLLDDLVQVGNSKVANRYLFAGEATTTEPFAVSRANGTITGVTYQGRPASSATGIQLEVGAGLRLRIDVTGDVALQPAIDALLQIRDHLRDGSPAARDSLRTVDLAQLDQALDTLLRYRAEVGGRLNRLELVRSRLQETQASLTEVLSQTLDADIPKAIMDLKQQEAVYRMALAANARIIQPSLLDFLR